MTRKIMIIAHQSSLTMQVAAAVAQVMVEAPDDVEIDVGYSRHTEIIDDRYADITHMSSEPRFRDIHFERHKAPSGHRPRDQYRNKGRRT